MIVSSLVFTLIFGLVNHSILPLVEQVERIEYLSPKKYAPVQIEEMSSALHRKEECIRLATYNILFNIKEEKFDLEHRWAKRLDRVTALIFDIQPDILGVQELYPDQLADLAPQLQESFAFYAPTGEYRELNAIFYRKARFELIDSHVWFLPGDSAIHISETLTMVQLRDLKTGQSLAVFNAHLPFSTADQRDLHAHLIVEKIASVAGTMPLVLMGDLNTFPNRPDLPGLPFYDGEHVCRIFTDGNFLADARHRALMGHVGPMSTFTNDPNDPRAMPFKGTGTPGVFLDHIFVSQGIDVLLHAVQPGTVDGQFPSDHMPLFIDCLLRPRLGG